MSARDDRRWKVGELAQATGLTVRTIHHYDELGLLVPSERTWAGHRLYAADDVRRLYRILALRQLGLPLTDIAYVLDERSLGLVDTVRRHLQRVEDDLEQGQRLRRRLVHILDALERSVEPSVDQFIDAMEVMAMIETTVRDVLVRVPSEEVEDGTPLHLLRQRQPVMLLKEQDGERLLPIWIGFDEGLALMVPLRGTRRPRPLGPDLTVRLLELTGAEVKRVAVESLRENTYYATITVAAGGESHEVDARPSDAINLGARVGAPIFVDSTVMDEQGVVSEAGLESWLSERDEHMVLGTEPAGEWRSLSPELIRSLYPSGGPKRE